jgi:hypothetical protein
MITTMMIMIKSSIGYIFKTIHKLHTNAMHYIFTFYSLTPTYVSAFTRPSSGGS